MCDAIIDPALDNSAIAATAAITGHLLITGAMTIASKHVIASKVSYTALVERDRPLGTVQSSGSAIRNSLGAEYHLKRLNYCSTCI